jgi:hypothetical protein
VADYPYKVHQRVRSLIETLETLTKHDPDQEVGTFALPDAVVEAIKDDIGRDNPVGQAGTGVVSPETVETREPIRPADAFPVAKMLDSEIGPHPTTLA